MTEINTTIRPACETCRAGCQSNRRRFWVQVFQPGAQIDFDSESGHLLFIIGGEIEIVHAEGTDIGKQDEMVLLGYNREYCVMALTQVKLFVINFTTHYHVCDDIQAENVWKSIRSVKYQFNTLEMKPAMRRFAESVMYYLEQGACCNHLYDAKAIEIQLYTGCLIPQKNWHGSSIRFYIRTSLLIPWSGETMSMPRRYRNWPTFAVIVSPISKNCSPNTSMYRLTGGCCSKRVLKSRTAF